MLLVWTIAFHYGWTSRPINERVYLCIFAAMIRHLPATQLEQTKPYRPTTSYTLPTIPGLHYTYLTISHPTNPILLHTHSGKTGVPGFDGSPNFMIGEKTRLYWLVFMYWSMVIYSGLIEMAIYKTRILACISTLVVDQVPVVTVCLNVNKLSRQFSMFLNWWLTKKTWTVSAAYCKDLGWWLLACRYIGWIGLYDNMQCTWAAGHTHCTIIRYAFVFQKPCGAVIYLFARFIFASRRSICCHVPWL